MLEVYKFEVGTSIATYPQTWTFYWSLQNTSGRTPMQVPLDIAVSLEGILGWFSALRSFWPVGSRCHLYRMRRVFPTIEPWVDMFFQFASYGGRFFINYGTSGSTINLRWVTDNDRIHTARSEMRYFPSNSIEQDTLIGQFGDVCKAFCDLHVGLHVTANGDTFRPCIFGIDGAFHNVIAYWIDTRVSFSRRRTKR